MPDLAPAIGDFDPWEDSFAQWAMAILSVIATGFSGWAVFLVRSTLSLNREAVNAAIASNNQARELFIVENRPWLQVVEARAGSYTEDDGRERSFLGVKVKNVGNGHALHVEIHAEVDDRSIVIVGNKPVVDFATAVEGSTDWGNTIIFAMDKDELIPNNPLIDEIRGYALICITYRSAHSPGETYRTACAISLYTGGGHILPGSMYVT